MNLSEANLELQNAAAWPLAIKIVSILLVCFLVAGLWVYMDTLDQLANLETREREEETLKQTFETKQKRAVNLAAYKEQLREIQKSFGALLRQLPNRTEVAELLVDVSQTGLASGLEFELFKPAGENRKDFYADLPINVRVVGTYKQFGAFVSGLASLPRIVTIHDVKISPQKGGKKLTMSALVKTYRYLNEGEQQTSIPKGKKRRGKK